LNIASESSDQQTLTRMLTPLQLHSPLEVCSPEEKRSNKVETRKHRPHDNGNALKIKTIYMNLHFYTSTHLHWN